jgi:multidrug efflux pump subunit AcrA (membrane-fusion protein)
MRRGGRFHVSLLLWIVVLTLLLGGGVVLARRIMTPTVQVTRLTTGPVVQAFYATGTVSPEREYSVHSNVAGILFLEPGIDKGVLVKKDQLLARVVSDDLGQKLKQAEAELEEKKARADEKTSPVLTEFDKRAEAYTEIMGLAKRELQRLMTLAETGNAQQVEIERTQDRIKTIWSELESVKAQRAAKVLEVRKDLEVAQAGYDMAKWNSDQQEIHAPIDGVILDWPIANRTRMVINDTILTLADVRPEKLVMRAQVDEEDKNKLRISQLVQMTLYSFPNDKDKFTGHVKTIYQKADPQRRTFEVDVEIDRPTIQPTSRPVKGAELYDQFSPGMTGELAFIEMAKKEAMILPRQALQGDAFYVVRGGKLDRVEAKAGVRNVTRVEVLGGIDRDALVMLSPVGSMQPGQSVRTEFIDPRVAADLNKPKDVEVFKGGF